MGWASSFKLFYKNLYLKQLGKACLAFSVYFTFTDSVADVYRVGEVSMEPTLSDGQLVVVQPVRNLNGLSSFLPALDHFVVQFGDIQRGDLVIAKHPSEPHLNICKRVTGVEGDRIPQEYRQAHRFVPPGQVWVEGDNSTESRDSRNYGPVPLGLVKGKVVARVWPVQDFGMVE